MSKLVLNNPEMEVRLSHQSSLLCLPRDSCIEDISTEREPKRSDPKAFLTRLPRLPPTRYQFLPVPYMALMYNARVYFPKHPLHPNLKHAWLALAIGPRNRIGMELALTELKLVSVLAARVLHNREAWDE
ncbi:hypothetical protein BBP40_009798 [Aspergillus hancockii]|nr:hypothetical protein BBP40_009798 [Aspergillus hancockii]